MVVKGLKIYLRGNNNTTGLWQSSTKTTTITTGSWSEGYILTKAVTHLHKLQPLDYKQIHIRTIGIWILLIALPYRVLGRCVQ